MALMDDNIIQKIIDSEKLAQAVVEEAREERRCHDMKTQADIDAYREKARTEADASVARFAQEQQERAKAEAEAIGREADKRIAALRDAAEAHMHDWVDAQYRKILDGGIG